MACNLSPLVDHIARQYERGGTWRLSGEDIQALLRIDMVDYHRSLYAAARRGNDLVALSDMTTVFDQGNVGLLVSTLEVFCGEQAERPLVEAGVFLTYERQTEIVELLIETAARHCASHRVDLEQFSAMLRVFRRYDRALDVYLGEFLPLGRITGETAESYCRRASFVISGLARRNIEDLIGMLLRRHVLSRETLLASVVDRLREHAVREGYLKTDTRGRRTAGRSEARAEQRRASFEAARRTLGLQSPQPTLAELRDRYRQLMKLFHPDLNPAGLEKSKDINAAYALLASELVGSAGRL